MNNDPLFFLGIFFFVVEVAWFFCGGSALLIFCISFLILLTFVIRAIIQHKENKIKY